MRTQARQPRLKAVLYVCNVSKHQVNKTHTKYNFLENDRFKIYDRCPMTDVAMAISTDADTDADVAYLDHLVTS